MLVRSFCVPLGRRDKTFVVLGRAIERVQLHTLAACVDHIVPGTRWNDESVVGLDLGSLTVDPNLTFALLNSKKLIPALVHLFADFLARRQ